ncbi:hypothetical protein Fot_48145 [Forsythia ovata]|uniref:Uncharacterized protein n=1 Tax=Forsythia ovata TaxID=205694 RepID=A0ABD1QT99_9LAMI
MAGFHFSKIPMFKIRGGRVVEERWTLSLRLLVSSMALNPASTILLVMEAAGDVSSPLPPLSSAPIPVTIVIPIIEVGDNSSSLPSETSMSPSVDVQHQDEGKESVVDEREKVALKRRLEEEGTVVDSRRVKRSRTAPSQETLESVSTSPLAAQDFLSNSSDWLECINIGSHLDVLDPSILEKLSPSPATVAASVHK